MHSLALLRVAMLKHGAALLIAQDSTALAQLSTAQGSNAHGCSFLLMLCSCPCLLIQPTCCHVPFPVGTLLMHWCWRLLPAHLFRALLMTVSLHLLLVQLTKELMQEAGWDEPASRFNLNSPVVLNQILFDR